jgi:RimJ/RimL family protein N-acetyltransferase
MPVVVRPATAADAAAIAAIHVASWQAAYRGLLPDAVLAGQSPAAREAQWRTAFERGTPDVAVAVADERIVGWIAFAASRDADAGADTGEVWALYVAPEHWRHGAGRALLAAANAQFAAAGHARATLWVLAGNARALAFYEAAGYAVAPGAERSVAFGGIDFAELRLAARVAQRVVTTTARLELRELDAADDGDAAFVRRLLNEPSWLRYIGERNVRSDDDARRYIADGPGASYVRHGFGLWLVVRRADGARCGICGLIRRDALPDVDVGFAFLPEFWGRGYAFESGAAALAFGRRAGLGRIVGITDPDNAPSIRVLERLGLAFETAVEVHGETLRLYACAP